MSSRSTLVRGDLLAIAVAFFLTISVSALAENGPAPNLLLPRFEIDLESVSTRTVLSVVNASAAHSRVEISVLTNWGIPALSVEAELRETETYSFDLTKWIVTGHLNDRTLTPEALEDLHAKLTGTQLRGDGLFYGTQVAPSLATGYVVIRSLDYERGSLMGDGLIVEPATNHVQGGPLVPLDQDLHTDCARHAIRIPDQSWLSDSPRLAVWTGRRFEPSSTPVPSGTKAAMTARIYDNAGNQLTDCSYELVATQLVDLCLDDPMASIGWLEVTTDVPVEVVGRLQPIDDGGLETQAFCLPENLDLVPRALALTTRVNGGGSDGPPGTIVPSGEAIELTYEVANGGETSINSIVVSDRWGLRVHCPGSTLEPDATLACSASGIAAPCRTKHSGYVTARSEDGTALSASDDAWSTGTVIALVVIESRVNGEDADLQPGPTIDEGLPLALTYEVSNLGEAALTELEIIDSAGFTVTCPKLELAAGEAITCSASGVAIRGQHDAMATVKAKSTCRRIEASDPLHYFGRAVEPAIQIVKTIDGFDANTPPGPSIPVGQTIEYRFVVTNVGTEPLSSVTVSDDVLGAIACPKASLDPSESMTCTGASVAQACARANVATAAGTSPQGTNVSDDDAAHYFGTPDIAIGIATSVNGYPADVAPGPYIGINTTLQLTYMVTNRGNVQLSSIVATDDQGPVVSCPKTILEPGESMTCTASGIALAGTHVHAGAVTGVPPCGDTATASDAANYHSYAGGLTLEKRVNGLDADAPPGLAVLQGDPILWTFVATNTGSSGYTVTVEDDQGVTVICPKSSLAPGESMTCTASGVAIAGQYVNTATATESIEGITLATESDVACYDGHVAEIAIQVLTNGEDADVPPGPKLPVGATVLWTYVVTNTGDISLSTVSVADDRGVAVTCPKSVLAPAESMTCTASGVAVAGQYSNIGTATGTALARPFSASDPSHYSGVAANQGCTPSYWKNHMGSWPLTGYSPSQTVQSVFSQVAFYPSLGSSTLLASLSFSGGSGTSGAAEIVLRAGGGALRNASHQDVGYPRSTSDVISQVNAALASQNRDALLSLAAQLDADNNLGCPLN